MLRLALAFHHLDAQPALGGNVRDVAARRIKGIARDHHARTVRRRRLLHQHRHHHAILADAGRAPRLIGFEVIDRSPHGLHGLRQGMGLRHVGHGGVKTGAAEAGQVFGIG
ncbi:hypothetical protein D3C71_1786540 [compost metagenome]